MSLRTLWIFPSYVTSLDPCCCWVASVVSDSVWPHGQQPTRLLCPRDSLGKNTGVGCHFLLHLTLEHSLNIIFIIDLSWWQVVSLAFCGKDVSIRSQGTESYNKYVWSSHYVHLGQSWKVVWDRICYDGRGWNRVKKKLSPLSFAILFK